MPTDFTTECQEWKPSDQPWSWSDWSSSDQSVFGRWPPGDPRETSLVKFCLDLYFYPESPAHADHMRDRFMKTLAHLCCPSAARLYCAHLLHHQAETFK